MFSALVSLVLLANTVSSTPPRNTTANDSVSRFRNAQEVRVENRREAVDEFRSNRAEFREKVAQVRDERKREILTNLDERIESVNTKWVEHWNEVLSRLSSIVSKIEARDETIDTSGADAAIARAQNAVNEQAVKVYEIEIDGEETLGQNARAALQEFHQDLREVQAFIKEARGEVVELLRILKANTGEESNEE